MLNKLPYLTKFTILFKHSKDKCPEELKETIKSQHPTLGFENKGW